MQSVSESQAFRTHWQNETNTKDVSFKNGNAKIFRCAVLCRNSAARNRGTGTNQSLDSCESGDFVIVFSGAQRMGNLLFVRASKNGLTY